MESLNSELVEPLGSTESVPLLSPLRITYRERLGYANFVPRGLCLPSKAAVLILVWVLVVSAINETLEESIRSTIAYDISHNLDVLLTYVVFVLISLLYPFSGFLADVCCGRYRTVIFSLCLLLCGFGLIGFVIVLWYPHVIQSPFSKHQKKDNPEIFHSLVISGILLIIMGLSGFYANFIQFGLDQLMDASSEYLGLFVHWVRWIIMLGTFLIRPLFAVLNNCRNSNSYKALQYSVNSLGPFLFVILLVIIIFSCWKRRWFYTEPGHQNPYKMVFKVLNFARKHKYPLRRSAFTYCDDEEPSRIDFAKERYGGPFTTEQVEDVKTLFRVIVILLVLGPAFFLEIPGAAIIQEYANHTGNSISDCSVKSVVQNMRVLGLSAMVVIFPLYIWLIYCVLRRCIPKTLIRIWIGEFLLVSGLTAMFLIDLSGHAKYHSHNHQAAQCMFLYRSQNKPSFFLDLPWAVNVIPVFLTTAGITLVITTILEFISAQSPRSMKGLLIGMFYAIRGVFKFLGAVIILPFSQKRLWTTAHQGDHSVINCGFGYLLLNCLVGAIGLVLFSVAAKLYRYRKRDDPPFNQMNVETVWANS